jgi:DNA-directed RNA polymerase subunit RPC12/RpoP
MSKKIKCGWCKKYFTMDQVKIFNIPDLIRCPNCDGQLKLQ